MSMIRNIMVYVGFFFFCILVKMTILKETIQNKHIVFACKYVETSLLSPGQSD